MMWWCLMVSVAGFAALCMAMSRHQRDVLGRLLPIATTRWLKCGGWVALAAAWAVAAAAEGPGLGSVYWAGVLTLAALVVSLTITRLSR
jgi:hypothetical protein